MARPTTARDNGRGRQAERPRDIPKAGWRDIALRTKNELSEDHASLVAAGVAFYILLAIFPAIAALISIWGLVADPAQIERQLGAVAGALPQDAAAILTEQAHNVAANAGGGVSLAAIGGILFALYSASAGMRALIDGLNVIYEEEEKRGFIKLYFVSLVLTLAVLAMMIAALGVIVVVPVVLGVVGLGGVAEALISVLRWPLLFALALLVLAVVYRYAPSRDRPRWRWVSWGAVAATALWIVGSIAFSIYVRNFGRYDATYGSLGAVIILLMWLWLSAFIVLLGAEVNSEMEHQTARDTTEGPEQPRGRRGARMADTVGRTP
jgi:membrane protein